MKKTVQFIDEDQLRNKISQNIRTEIDLSGKSKSDIAKAIGVSKPTLSQYLSGKVQPSLITLASLCSYLEISAHDILEIKK